MTTFLTLAAIFVLSSVVTEAAKLPTYISACKIDDPELNACAKRNGQAALATVIKGDKEYKIPVLTPLKLTHIGLEASKNLQVDINNVEIFGLEDAVITDTAFNVKDKTVKITLAAPLITIIAEYTMNGKILILPIQGSGPCNITSVNGNYSYSMSYELQKNKKGVEHAKIIESQVIYETERAYFQLKNLFNGDKVLGEQMSIFLDENWREVNQEIGPAISETVNQVVTAILTALFDKVSYKNIFM